MSVVLLEQLQDIIVKTFSSPEITDLTVMMEIKNICTSNIVCTPPSFLLWERGVEPLTKFSKSGRGVSQDLDF